MEYAHRDLLKDLIKDLNTLTTIARANVITKDVKALDIGETRPAAILFLDIVNYTNLSKKLPCERLSMLIDRIFQIFLLSVRAYGGYCDKVIGDAGLYVFTGHPSQPPAIEGALRAALVILERANQLRYSLEPQGIDFNVRIGVAFGDVTRERIGGENQQFTVMGDTVNLSQRLESSADPSTIQVLQDIVDKVGDQFQFESIGQRELKNVGLMSVFKVIRLTERIYKFRTSGKYLSRFVGREIEFKNTVNIINKWLKIKYPDDSYDITKMNKRLIKRNRLLIIRGSMAMGKSRMAYELLQYYADNFKANTTTAHCLTQNSLDLFGVELIRVAGLTEHNLPERWEELCSNAENVVSKEYAERQRRHLPLLAMLLNCKSVNTDRIRMIDAQSFAIGIQLAFCSACELVAHFSQKPVVVTIEDVQWLDSNEKLLANILASVSLPYPLVFIATARPEFKYNSQLFDDVCEYHEIQLNQIDSEDGRDLVESILPGIEFTDEAWQQIEEKASGIPYYYEEFAHMLVRRGYITEHNRRFKLTRSLTSLELPADIQMMILGKLDQLDPKVKLLVSKASVLGRVFLAKLLINIEGRFAEGEPDRIPQMLTQLIQNEIIIKDSEAKNSSRASNNHNSIKTGSNSNLKINSRNSNNEEKYFFKHIVTQESAYKAMLGRNKRLVHSLAVDVLETMLIKGSKDEKEMLISLIIHLEFLERHLDAHKRCCQLLNLLANTYQHEEWEILKQNAHHHWEKARIDNPNLPERSPWCLCDTIGVKLWRSGNFSEALIVVEEGLSLFKELNDKNGEARALHLIGLINTETNKYDLAMKHFEKSLELSCSIGDRHCAGMSLGSIGLVHLELARPKLAMKYFEQGIEIFCKIGDRRGAGLILLNIGSVHLEQGYYDKALQYFKQTILMLKEIGDRSGEGLSLFNIGIAYKNQGQYKLAMQYLDQALIIYREIGNRRKEGSTLKNIGFVHMEHNNFQLAKEYFEKSLELSHEQGNHKEVLKSIEALVQLMLSKNEFEKAKEYCISGEKLASEIMDRMNLGHFIVNWALIYSAEGEKEKSIEHIRKAKNILKELNLSITSDFGQIISKAETVMHKH